MGNSAYNPDLSFACGKLLDKSKMEIYKVILYLEMTKQDAKDFIETKKLLIKMLKIIKEINYTEMAKYFITNMQYKTASFLYGSDDNFERVLKLCIEENICERNCLNIFKQFLQKIKINKRKGISNLYLYIEELDTARKQRKLYFEQNSSIWHNSLKGILIQFPNQVDEEEIKETMEEIKGHSKTLE